MTAARAKLVPEVIRPPVDLERGAWFVSRTSECDHAQSAGSCLSPETLLSKLFRAALQFHGEPHAVGLSCLALVL